MAPPVVYTPTATDDNTVNTDPIHLFVADGTLWYLPLYRMVGDRCAPVQPTAMTHHCTLL